VNTQRDVLNECRVGALTSSVGRQFHFQIVSGTKELANAVVLEKG